MLPSTTLGASTEVLHTFVHQLDLLSGVVDPTPGSERSSIFIKDFFVGTGNCRVAAYSPATWDVDSNEDDALGWGIALLRDRERTE